MVARFSSRRMSVSPDPPPPPGVGTTSSNHQAGPDDDPNHHGEFRQEALQLYRDCLRLARGFPLSDPSDGIPWKIKLAQSARSEFEQARHETNKYEVGHEDGIVDLSLSSRMECLGDWTILRLF